MIDFQKHTFHPVIHLPPSFEVYDFTKGYDPDRVLSNPYGIGRYNEDRKGVYSAAIFQNPEGARTIHMGIDIAAPVNTPVYAFADGEIFLFANNDQPGDYGPTVITKHVIDGKPLYALFGHLSAKTLLNLRVGTKVSAGSIIGWIGEKSENGGWNPHLHFQISLKEPNVCDMPGVVNEAQRASALATYPDPRCILGPLYK